MRQETIGDVHKKDGATQPATHFYHPWMKKIYNIQTKPRLDYVLKKFPNVYVPRSTPRKAR
jgi:hypothetical protein